MESKWQRPRVRRVHESWFDTVPQHGPTVVLEFHVAKCQLYPNINLHTFTVVETASGKITEVNRGPAGHWTCPCSNGVGACSHIDRAWLYYRNMNEMGETGEPPPEPVKPTVQTHRRIRVRK